MTHDLLIRQVERLSGLVEMGPERIGKVEDQLRLQVINSTININKRLVNLYELIENDLLGSLQFSVGYIAPYGVSHLALMHLTGHKPHAVFECEGYGHCLIKLYSLQAFVLLSSNTQRGQSADASTEHVSPATHTTAHAMLLHAEGALHTELMMVLLHHFHVYIPAGEEYSAAGQGHTNAQHSCTACIQGAGRGLGGPHRPSVL